MLKCHKSQVSHRFSKSLHSVADRGANDAVCGANDVQTASIRRTNGAVSDMFVAPFWKEARNERAFAGDLCQSRQGAVQRRGNGEASESTEKGRKMKELPAGRTRFDCQRAELGHNVCATTRYYYIIRVKARTRYYHPFRYVRELAVRHLILTFDPTSIFV